MRRRQRRRLLLRALRVQQLEQLELPRVLRLER